MGSAVQGRGCPAPSTNCFALGDPSDKCRDGHFLNPDVVMQVEAFTGIPLGRQHWQPVVLIGGETVFDSQILSFNETCFFQSPVECRQK
jgi:hypothetical protein